MSDFEGGGGGLNNVEICWGGVVWMFILCS